MIIHVALSRRVLRRSPLTLESKRAEGETDGSFHIFRVRGEEAGRDTYRRAEMALSVHETDIMWNDGFESHLPYFKLI
jgi:hypothetical protein